MTPPAVVQHRDSLTRGTVLARQLWTPATGHPYIGDLAGWWIQVQWEDGMACWIAEASTIPAL